MGRANLWSMQTEFCDHCNGQVPARRATADALIELFDDSGAYRGIVLIERRNPPPGWAIPGGFLDPDEDLATCAIREAREETSLDVELTGLLGIYSAPGRDPRGLTVTAVYVARATGEPVADDDAAAVGVFSLDDLPDELAFDHRDVLGDYREYREGRRVLGHPS